MKSRDTAGFSSALRKLRIESGLTQKELASLSGISIYTISRYENGSQEPTNRHRALLAEVFGAPGYHLFDEDYVSGSFTPDATIKAQERIRLAMFFGDYEFVEAEAHKIHMSLLPEQKRQPMVQIKDYLRIWSFFRQGADPEYILGEMVECVRLSLPDFSIEEISNDTVPDRPLSYMEIQIINAIGVTLVRLGDYVQASHLFGMLIRETDSDMLSYERRIFRKVTLALNLALTLRKQGLPQDAINLLNMYSNNSIIMSTVPVCMMLLIGTYQCMDRRSDSFKKKRRHASMLHFVLTQEYGLKESLSQLEKETERGLMII